jgi:hypothetical protein
MRLIICSKSQWTPAIRREHAIATSAAAEGHEVVFIEQASHLRDVRRSGGTRSWIDGWRERKAALPNHVVTVRQSTVVPGHHSSIAERVDAARLAHTLRRVSSPDSVVVAMLPWQWSAVARAPARRRVFDCTDDWRVLIGSRAARVQEIYNRIGDEADLVISVSRDLNGAFGERPITVIGNGVDASLTRVPVSPVPDALRFVYAGTLSERFDASLMRAALDRLPGWTAELYGECRYAGCGGQPSSDLQAALAATDGRMVWRGPVERSQLAAVLDRGRVLVAPHRDTFTFGQNSMKLYDYAARERPIVATRGALGGPDHIAAAGVIEVDSAAEFAAAVDSLSWTSAGVAPRRSEWLLEHSWAREWERWSQLVFAAGEQELALA